MAGSVPVTKETVNSLNWVYGITGDNTKVDPKTAKSKKDEVGLLSSLLTATATRKAADNGQTLLENKTAMFDAINDFLGTTAVSIGTIKNNVVHKSETAAEFSKDLVEVVGSVVGSILDPINAPMVVDKIIESSKTQLEVKFGKDTETSFVAMMFMELIATGEPPFNFVDAGITYFQFEVTRKAWETGCKGFKVRHYSEDIKVQSVAVTIVDDITKDQNFQEYKQLAESAAFANMRSALEDKNALKNKPRNEAEDVVLSSAPTVRMLAIPGFVRAASRYTVRGAVGTLASLGTVCSMYAWRTGVEKTYIASWVTPEQHSSKQIGCGLEEQVIEGSEVKVPKGWKLEFIFKAHTGTGSEYKLGAKTEKSEVSIGWKGDTATCSGKYLYHHRQLNFLAEVQLKAKDV